MLDGFTLEWNGRLYTDEWGFSAYGKPWVEKQADGSVKSILKYVSDGSVFEVSCMSMSFPDTKIIDRWLEVRNISNRPVQITRMDTVRGIVPAGNYTLKYYTSAWGREFEPVDIKLAGTKILECTAGRSSMGMHPWFSLAEECGYILTGSIAWSGNWIARFEPSINGTYQITAGLNNWFFSKILKPQETLEAPHVIHVALSRGDLNDTSVEFGRWGRKYWYAKNALSESMPAEWNSWWPYEDDGVSEEIFRSNADICAGMGIDVCTQDAGWFGPSEENSLWYEVRGDWHKVNEKRFPSGIRAISDYAHNKGLKFGIWCEIEASGKDAGLMKQKPELAARRDARDLGYVCMGNPDSVSWAFGVLEKLIADYGADWIKLDFNLDPGAGCNRTDHGHGEGDGLFEHYRGYYRLLETVREKYPHVLLEDCSSGGLRIDLGLMKHNHMAFLSDPDYPVHDLQIFWGASTMLHPSKCLHWSWSQTRERFKFNMDNDPLKTDMPRRKLDYYIRISMLGAFGYSYRLPDLPAWILERLDYHVHFYKDSVRGFVQDADMFRLTGQALRSGGGDRWNAFQYVKKDESASLLFVFRLTGSEDKRLLLLKGLAPDKLYRLAWVDGGVTSERTGRELMETGLLMTGLEEEASEIVMLIQPPADSP